MLKCVWNPDEELSIAIDRIILHALICYNGSKSLTARKLGIAPTILRRKISGITKRYAKGYLSPEFAALAQQLPDVVRTSPPPYVPHIAPNVEPTSYVGVLDESELLPQGFT